jgi:hypothetical protein
MAWSPTSDQILNLRDVRRRFDRFRFELCDQNWNPIGTLHPDREQNVPTVELDTSSNTMRRLTGFKLLPDEVSDVAPLKDRLRVYMTLQNNAEYRLGSFLWVDANEPKRSWGDEHHGELVDPGFILDQKSTRAFGWGRGATITLVMFFLMFQAGFELKDIATIGEEANRSLADPIAWQPGVTWHQMLVDLGNLVGFTPPWFDRDGRLHFDLLPDHETEAPTVPALEDNTRIIRDSILSSNDLGRAPNDFATVDSGTDRILAGRFQLPASAPHSFQNRGFRIGEVETVQGMETQAQADKATLELAKKTKAFEILTLTTTADPRHDVFAIVPAYGKRWLETAWSLECRSGGLHNHTLQRVAYGTQ